MNSKHSKAFRLIMVVGVLAGWVLFVGAAEPKGGCGQGLDNRAGEAGVDVGGVAGASWQLTYQDTMTVVIKNAGAVVATYPISVATGGSFDVDGVTINLSQLCGRSDVACPTEVFPSQVTMTQPGGGLHLLYVTFNPAGPLKDVGKTTLLGNVDSDFDFSVALGVGGATNGVCGLLGVSYATGKIATDSAEPPSGTSLTGDIVTAYSGGCIVSGSSGAAAAGLTVEFRVPFSGSRSN